MSWFENLAGCMLAVSLALRMLPDKKYEQYVRLFTGFLLVLLFLQPLLRIGSADELMEQKIEQFVEEQEAVEKQIFDESADYFKQNEMEAGQEEKNVKDIVIEPVELGCPGMIKKLDREKLLIGVLVGLLLIVIAVPLPGEKEEKEKSKVPSDAGRTVENGSTEELEKILGKISGVGAVDVFITYEDSGRVVVEKDEAQSEEMVKELDSSGGSRTTTTTENKRETVYGNGEQPYVVQQLTPKVEGVLVVAEGAGNVSVKRQIMETIKALFGLESHKISIMKMEVSK